MGDPVTTAQGAGAADRTRTGANSRAVRRGARFSDLLGALAEGNGPTEEKRKADQASGESPGATFPLFPLGSGNDAARCTNVTPKLGPMAPGGPGDAVAPALVAPDEVDIDLAPQCATPQTNATGLGGQGLLPGAFDSPGSARELITAVNSAGPSGMAIVSNSGPMDTASTRLLPCAPAAQEFFRPVSRAAAGGDATSLEKFAALADREQPPAAKAVPSMMAAPINEDGLSAKADRAQQGSENAFEVPSASASTATGDEPLLAATPDPVRLGTHLAVPASDGVAETAAPAGASAQHRDEEAPARLAFTARVVPVPAGDVGVPATGADVQQPVFSGAKPAAERTPVPSVPHFANNPKREDSSEVIVRTAVAEPPVVSSLSPAASTETAAPPASESERSEPAPPHSPPNVLTEAKTTPQTSPAREIQLQFHQGEQRVDVRLSELSGEMQVTVRTPDAQLAGALRAGLPALSARLEQTGFRAETWHPAIAHESARPVGHVSPSVSDSSDSRNESRQGGQQQPQPRQQRFNTAHAAKTQRKEFRWFMSQLP